MSENPWQPGYETEIQHSYNNGYVYVTGDNPWDMDDEGFDRRWGISALRGFFHDEASWLYGGEAWTCAWTHGQAANADGVGLFLLGGNSEFGPNHGIISCPVLVPQSEPGGAFGNSGSVIPGYRVSGGASGLPFIPDGIGFDFYVGVADAGGPASSNSNVQNAIFSIPPLNRNGEYEFQNPEGQYGFYYYPNVTKVRYVFESGEIDLSGVNARTDDTYLLYLEPPGGTPSGVWLGDTGGVPPPPAGTVVGTLTGNDTVEVVIEGAELDAYRSSLPEFASWTFGLRINIVASETIAAFHGENADDNGYYGGPAVRVKVYYTITGMPWRPVTTFEKTCPEYGWGTPMADAACFTDFVDSDLSVQYYGSGYSSRSYGYETRMIADTGALTTGPAPVTRQESADPWGLDVSDPYISFPDVGYQYVGAGNGIDPFIPAVSFIQTGVSRDGFFSAAPPNQTKQDRQTVNMAMTTIDVDYSRLNGYYDEEAFNAFYNSDDDPVGFEYLVEGWNGPSSTGYPQWRYTSTQAIDDDYAAFIESLADAPATYVLRFYATDGGTSDTLDTNTNGFPSEWRVMAITSGISLADSGYGWRYAIPTGGFVSGATVTTFDVTYLTQTASMTLSPSWLVDGTLTLAGDFIPAGYNPEFHGDAVNDYDEGVTVSAWAWIEATIDMPAFRLIY